MVIPLARRFDWQVWHETWIDWQSVIAVPEILVAPSRQMLAEPPAPSSNEAAPHVVQGPENFAPRVLSADDDEEFDVEEQKAEFMTREHARLRKRYRVVIEKNNNKFETYTLNISEGGMLLEHPLPDWVIGYCDVKVIRIDTKQALDLTCAVVENQEPSHRVRLQIVEDKAGGLKHWLSAA